VYTKDKEAQRIVEFVYAASNGNQRHVEHLLNKRVPVNAVDYDKRSALHLAAANGHLQVVEMLIAARADVDAVDRWGHTVLDEAVAGNFEDVMSALRVAGASHGVTPRMRPRSTVADGVKMCSAAAKGSVEAIAELHDEGMDVNAVDYDGRSALHIAASNGHLELVQWLIQQKVNISLRDNFGLTGMAEAERNGHYHVVQVLRAAGADSADLESLRLSSDTEHWAIPSSDIIVGHLLGKTMKSCIYRATWRGTPVVAKTSKELHRACSGTSLVSLVESESSEDSVTAKAAEEVLHEIRLLSTMRHPDLVMFLGACFDSNPPFFIIEFMEGGDLERHYYNKSRQLGHSFRPSWDQFLMWAMAVARALSFLHSRPIIHRDLKPLNLLLNKTLDLKVTDFGISKLVRPDAVGFKGQAQMSGGVGTWRYMAPEVVRYEQYTDRVDIYSYALILWFMYTGLQPFEDQFGSDAEVVLKEYLKGKEPRPDETYAGSRCGPSIPGHLRAFIKDCWHEQPQTRPSADVCTQRLASISAEGDRSSFRKFTGIFR